MQTRMISGEAWPQQLTETRHSLQIWLLTLLWIHGLYKQDIQLLLLQGITQMVPLFWHRLVQVFLGWVLVLFSFAVMIFMFQERFFRDSIRLRNASADTCWYIPVSYTTEKELDVNTTTPKTWMTCPLKETTISGLPSDSWLLLNLQLACELITSKKYLKSLIYMYVYEKYWIRYFVIVHIKKIWKFN